MENSLTVIAERIDDVGQVLWGYVFPLRQATTDCSGILARVFRKNHCPHNEDHDTASSPETKMALFGLPPV